jgi:hypothetical protein
VKVRSLNGGDWSLVHGEICVVMTDHGSATAADLERLSRRWGRLKLLGLRFWLRRLRHVSVAVVELKIPRKGD